GVQGLDGVGETVQVVDVPHGYVGAADLVDTGTGLVDGTEGEGDAAAVDHRVHHRVDDDLRTQRMRGQGIAVILTQRCGEVLGQRPGEPGALGEGGLCQVVL